MRIAPFAFAMLMGWTSAWSQIPGADKAALDRLRASNLNALDQVQRALPAVPRESGGTLAPSAARSELKAAAPPASIPAFAPSGQKPRDLAKLVERFQQTKPTGQKTTGVLVFVSLSMPAAVLQQLARQAATAGATLVLRGFVAENGQAPGIGSTTARLAALMNVTPETPADKVPSWSIDPDAFQIFRITQVPAFVVAQQTGETTGCAADNPQTSMCEDAWDAAIVYGDMSLAQAMQYAARSKQPAIARLARNTVERFGSVNQRF